MQRRPTPERTQLISGITASAVEKPARFLRDPQQQQKDLTTRKLATTMLASAGKLTATEVPKTEWTPTTHDIFEKFAEKLFRTAKKLCKKTQKE